MGEMQDQCVVILPNMVDDIGLLCLARLPHSCRAKARCVCRSWRRALANPSSLRRSFNLQSAPEHCLFIALFDTDCDPSYLRATEHNTRWLFIHPSSLQTTEPLPNPLSQISTDRLNLRSVAATSANLFLPDIPDNKIEGFQSYNAEHRRRSAVPFAAPDYKHVRLYACAALGDLVFFSGGQNDVTGTAQSSGCMYDAAKCRWEILPNMIKLRIDCTGIVMDGKFVVIGGSYNDGQFMRVHASGEAYDPKTGRWTLLPDLWANGLNYVDESNAAQPGVAVVGGHTLYTLQSHSNELMRFDPLINRWVSVGFVGGELQRNPCLSYKVIAVGEELWVVEHAMGRDIRIHAGMPPKNCRDGRTVLNFREVKLPELEGFDHVLTCTVLAL
ncbi:F-box/kelch-repeat protein At5g60570 [Cryptomeria japonica]|uniref:F-box/kelch-repeat protein At5g60570 n=1 Tax=Cryptomeria japonica TaxID=3369 RepID=UPI0027DA98BD|nr:F-box/kelch-repeat protein At5g60570 [Cryptomeria japonica]